MESSNNRDSTFFLRKFIIPILLFIFCFLLYGNTLLNGYASDDIIITKNEFIIKGFSAFTDIFNKGSLYGFDRNHSALQYRPLTLLNFMTEVSLFGLNPHISHFFNILFFALTVVLLYFFLQKTLKNYSPAIIVAATLLFAFHPIHTEVVANIKSRDEILGLLFGLISFYFVMLQSEQPKKKYYFFSLLAFLAAIFCKENCLTFIVIIPLLLYFFTGLEIKKIALKTIPYIGLVVFYLLIRMHVLQNITINSQIPVWDNALIAAGNGSDMSATTFVLLGKYIFMTIVPYPLSWDYSYNQIPIVAWGNIKPILALSVCLFLIGYMLWGFRKKIIYSFLIALFFITLSLSSNLVIKISATFGERFLYVPSLSFCIALPLLLARVLKLSPLKDFPLAPKPQTPKGALSSAIQSPFRGLGMIIAGILIIYVFIVIPRNRDWENNYTLYQSGIKTSPNSWRTHGGLGETYIDSALSSTDTAKISQFHSLAEQELKKATELCPMVKNVLVSYQNQKNYALAFHYDSLVLKKDPGNKQILINLSVLHDIMGVQYASNNELGKAIGEFNTALRCDTNSARAFHNLGEVYLKTGNIKSAKTYLQKALSKDPKNEIFARDLQALNGGN